MYQKPPPADRNKAYLGFIRLQPCCLCGDNVHVEAHHPRFGVGMAEKAGDRDAVPLCGRHHRELHAMNEREFWASSHIDPKALALRYQVMVRRRE